MAVTDKVKGPNWGKPVNSRRQLRRLLQKAYQDWQASTPVDIREEYDYSWTASPQREAVLEGYYAN